MTTSKPNSLSLVSAEVNAPHWQQQLREAIRTPQALADAVGLALHELPYAAAADAAFPLLVPRAFAARMRRGEADDPLLKQVLASEHELTEVAGYTGDPVAEVGRYGGTPGILQKYNGRALLVLTGQCAINCRYCFRRHYPYGDNALSSAERRARIAQLLEDPAFKELILSGGDPLVLPDRQLAAISDQLADARPGMTLRVHSRLPIVIPDRVTPELIDALCGPALHSVMVLHANHPNEIDSATAHAIGRLRHAGITVLNQAVMLRGVNDDAQTLAALGDRLFAAGALPYYLHLLDKVAGAAHFDTDRQHAREIVGELAEIRPGYLVPRLVEELAGAGSKREVSPLYPTDSHRYPTDSAR